MVEKHYERNGPAREESEETPSLSSTDSPSAKLQDAVWETLRSGTCLQSDSEKDARTEDGGKGSVSSIERISDQAASKNAAESHLPSLSLTERSDASKGSKWQDSFLSSNFGQLFPNRGSNDHTESEVATNPGREINDRAAEKPESLPSSQMSDYRPSRALDLFKLHAAPDEKPLLEKWLQEGLATAVHESIHLLSKDELGGYLTPDLKRFPRIDADKEFGNDKYLPTPKSTITGIPNIPGMTDTYLTGREAASSAKDFGFWLDELNAYNSETLLHKEKGGKGVDVNFTGVTMFGAGYMQYLNRLDPQQRGKLFNEHGDTLRKMWSTTEDAMAYGASQGFPTESPEYFNKFFGNREHRNAMEKLMGRQLRIPELPS